MPVTGFEFYFPAKSRFFTLENKGVANLAQARKTVCNVKGASFIISVSPKERGFKHVTINGHYSKIAIHAKYDGLR